MLALYRSGRQVEALEVTTSSGRALQKSWVWSRSPCSVNSRRRSCGRTGSLTSVDYLRSCAGTQTGDRALRRAGEETNSGTALDPEAHEVVSEYSESGLAAVLER